MSARRLKGEGSVYQRGDGRWVAAVSVGRKPDGTRDRRVAYGWTPEEALAAKAELLAKKGERRGDRARRPGTLDAYLQAWIEGSLAHRVASGDLAASTRGQYAEKVKLYVIGTELGRTKLRDVTPDDVRRWMTWLSGRKTARGRAMTPGGVALAYRILRAALQDAVDDGLLVRSPAATVKAPKQIRFDAHPLTPQQAKAVIAQKSTLHALWVCFLYVGLRHAEALALRWDDVDLDRGVISVRGTKTAGSRATVPIPKAVVEALRAHRTAQRQRRLAAPVWVDPGLVFASAVGTPLNPSNVAREFNRVCDRVGISHRRIHDLRHTTASLLYVAGVPVETISVILRHKSPTVTREIYTHVFENLRRDAVDSLGHLLAD